MDKAKQKFFNDYLIKNKIKLNFNVVNLISNKIEFSNSEFNIFDIHAKNKIDNTYKSIIISYQLCKKNIFSGLVTLPLNKELIIKKIAITALPQKFKLTNPVGPCGICRQVLLEYEEKQNADIEILLFDTKKIIKLAKAKDLLPFYFTEDRLKRL